MPPLNRPFPSCFEPHCESEAKCKAFHVEIPHSRNCEKIGKGKGLWDRLDMADMAPTIKCILGIFSG